MSENAIDSVKAPPEPAGAKPKRKPGKKAKPAKKVGRTKKAAAKPTADRAKKQSCRLILSGLLKKDRSRQLPLTRAAFASSTQ